MASVGQGGILPKAEYYLARGGAAFGKAFGLPHIIMCWSISFMVGSQIWTSVSCCFDFVYVLVSILFVDRGPVLLL